MFFCDCSMFDVLTVKHQNNSRTLTWNLQKKKIRDLFGCGSPESLVKGQTRWHISSQVLPFFFCLPLSVSASKEMQYTHVFASEAHTIQRKLGNVGRFQSVKLPIVSTVFTNTLWNCLINFIFRFSPLVSAHSSHVSLHSMLPPIHTHQIPPFLQ